MGYRCFGGHPDREHSALDQGVLVRCIRGVAARRGADPPSDAFGYADAVVDTNANSNPDAHIVRCLADARYAPFDPVRRDRGEGD